ncbi:RNase H family protein [Sphingomonas sp. LM7]|uniref:RNase H family protein n=1 Tax=Sphingomonas sp. LM7 TaxID=1938607 RepID=UPI000984ECF6|nr:RNase H family protein [Sphingomonas sp. LM7]
MKIYFDGGCRPNPGTMEVAVVAAGQTTILRDLGQGTSSDAEWLALIHALTIALTLGTDFVLLGDSADIIGKANGAVKCRDAGRVYLKRFRALAGSPARVRYIKRSQNLAGIALARSHVR